MDENREAQAAQETEENEAIVPEDFEALWDEDEDVHTEKADDAEPDAQPDDDGEADAEEDAQPEDQKTEEPEQKGDAEDQRVKLKHNGEEVEVDREKLIELAQKGLDYDRVKGERDSFKADGPTLQRYKEQEAFLQELAESGGMDVQALMDSTRARMLMAKEDGLSEQEALRRVRETARKAAEKKEETKAEPTPEERRHAMFADFLSAYPNVKAEEIPKEVWDSAAQNYDLTGAYRSWENKQLRAENEKLRQNQRNKERSTGSRKSTASSERSSFDKLWYEDD